MPAPKNPVKAALAEGRLQVGLWLALADPTVAEIAAAAGFDWCLIDAEHGPNTLQTILHQLQAMEGRGAAAVVRVPMAQDWMLKQVLDLGAQTVLVPMIDTADQARAVVRATRYAPQGARGLGAAMARASRHGAFTDYAISACAEICVLVQVETALGAKNAAEIAAVEGVDGVFIGPADLSADMGHLGKPDHPEVLAVIEQCLQATAEAGKAPGIITFEPERIAAHIAQGVTFLGVGSDATSLAIALRNLAARARG